MIRINLLGIPKARRGKRPSAGVSVGEGPSTGMLVLVLVAVLGVGMYMSYAFVNRQTESLKSDMQKANDENARLATVKAKYEATKLKAEQFKSRLDLIGQLHDQQSGPVNLLTMVADTINNTEQVWLEAMTDDGKSIDFTGMALTPDAVADLMANLQKTGAFKSVEIKETAQDSGMKELQAFKFELVCEKPPAGPKSADAKTDKTDKKS
jgi:Tfp pilus assembly protein PilN